MRAARLHDDVVDAALSTAATLLDMEVVLIGVIDGSSYAFARVRGEHPAIVEGRSVDYSATMCSRMVGGAAAAVADAALDPSYVDAPIRTEFGVTSYAGVPITDRTGRVIGTLCGIDRRSVAVPERAVAALRELAGVIAARLATTPDADDVLIRRTPAGWLVGSGEHEDSLTTAMSLADLLADDVRPPARPERAADDLDEIARLRASVAQLEHALAARVVVEQAIGVLAERTGGTPREAFEALRRVARRSGRRVHDLARDVVRSVSEDVELPQELAAR